MAGPVKLFSNFQKLSYLAGIFPLESSRNGPSIDLAKRVIIVVFVLTNFLTSAAFFVFDANSPFEYRLSFFSAAGAVTALSFYLLMIWQTENTRLFIENCERFIGTRNSLHYVFST